ncbi:MAG TPA: AraC family ligand binding domain-containing protein [Candidatus Saccharimonadales bacterium]|nr:AraC family ligand binding domain-containing protein [Candidatus Saccharimonadales bacterium]
MEYIKNKDAPRFKNSASCVATEYDFKDEKDFNIAGIELSGRYPEQGYALNTVSKELLYVKSGNGVLVSNGRTVALEPGDAALIQPNEKYYLEGTLELVISSAPAWYPGQHQNILD